MTGLKVVCSSTAKASDASAERVRRAEENLLRSYGVKDITTEIHLTLRQNPSLGGIRFARVLRIKLPSQTKGEGEEEDASGSRVPILFFHGGGGTVCDWLPLLIHLIKPGRSLYSVERPGNGLSEPLDYSTVDLAEFSHHFVAEVLHALDLTKVHLVGNSMGGGTIFWYGLRHSKPTEDLVSMSLIGIPACFQGMNIPFPARLIQPWMGTIASFFPRYIPFIPLIAVSFLLKVPLNAFSIMFLHYMWQVMSIRGNTKSFFSVIRQLYACAHEGKGWKLQDLQTLHRRMESNLMVITGKAEPFIKQSQQDEITCYIGRTNHICNLGYGHCPWFTEPVGVAIALERFWDEAER